MNMNKRIVFLILFLILINSLPVYSLCTPTLNTDWIITDSQICDSKILTLFGKIIINSGGSLNIMGNSNITVKGLEINRNGDSVFLHKGSKLIFTPNIDFIILQDTGSIITSIPGTYTHTFTSNATVNLSYLYGAGGGASYYGYPAVAGDNSLLYYDNIQKAIASGGQGAPDNTAPGSDGSASNTISSTNIVGGAGNGGWEPDTSGLGGHGGAVTGGSFSVSAGKNITIIVGAGHVNGVDDSAAGGDGSISLSWG